MHELDVVAEVLDGVYVVHRVRGHWCSGGCDCCEWEMPKARSGIACASEDVAGPVM